MIFGVIQFIVAALGCFIGIVFGALPGMTATMAVAVFLPMTYVWDLGTSMYFLLGLYVGGISGGLVPAILINIPGTPSSITAGYEGHPMAKRGEGVKALRTAITASLIGGLFSLVVLAFFTPILSKIAISFGAAEKFLIMIFALTMIAALSKGNIVKGVFTGILGILVSLIGVYAYNQKLRFVPSFLSTDLRDGFQLLPLLIGLFAFAQILQESEEGMKACIVDESILNGKQAKKYKFTQVFKGQIKNIIRSSSIGTFIGILPGIGGSAASLLSYSQAKTWSKHPELFGTGIEEGQIASETADNAVTGGALVPLLSLGIPGDATTAVLLGAFTLQGIAVGPLFIDRNPGLWYSIILALFLCNVITYALMFFPVKQLAKIIKIPKSYLYPAICLLCVVGAFSTRNGVLFDVVTLVLFGFIAYIFNKVGLPVTTFLIGFVLGGDIETYFMDSLQGSSGYLSCFFAKPADWVLWLLIIVSVGYAIWDDRREKKTNVENVLKRD